MPCCPLPRSVFPRGALLTRLGNGTQIGIRQGPHQAGELSGVVIRQHFPPRLEIPRQVRHIVGEQAGTVRGGVKAARGQAGNDVIAVNDIEDKGTNRFSL